MCSPATCPSCGKATWTGCGNHVEQALAGVPQNQRCEGHSGASSARSSQAAASTSLFSKLFSH